MPYRKETDKVLAAPAKEKKKGFFDQIIDPTMAAVKTAGEGFQKSQDITSRANAGSLIENLMNAPRNIIDSTAQDFKNIGNVLNVPATAVNSALGAAIRPVATPVSNAAYDVGIKPYSPSAPLGSAPLSRESAAEDLTNNLVTAVGLGVPEAGIKGSPTKLLKAPKQPKAALPSVDDLRAAKTAAYQQADNAGAVYNQNSVEAMLDELSNNLTAKRLNPKLAPTSSGLLEEAQSLRGKPASFNDIEEMRQLVGESVGPTASPREKMYADMMRKHFADFLDNAAPADMVTGDPVAQASAINNARAANVTYRKAEAINNALDKADLQAASSGSGGNIDNATRQKLRTLYQDKKMNWTPNEKMAFESAIRGGKVQNLLRLVGKLSPEGNGLMLAGQLAAAVPTGGASAFSALAGAGSKAAAEAMTRDKVNSLLRTVTGTTLPAPASVAPQAVPVTQPNGLFGAAQFARPVSPVQAPAFFAPVAAEEESKYQRKK